MIRKIERISPVFHTRSTTDQQRDRYQEAKKFKLVLQEASKKAKEEESKSMVLKKDSSRFDIRV